jgi:RNA polymerase sigma factor (TIGR02999 family)
MSGANDNERAEITALLAAWREGDRGALHDLMPLVYNELRRRARRQMRAENAGHLLQTTALVHEAYLRMVDRPHAPWTDRAHFFAAISMVIRHVLVDHARARQRAKRGGPAVQVDLPDNLPASQSSTVDMVALDAALDKLSALDAQQARVVELRYYGGLSVEEAAETLGISPATVKREWALARAWLRRELSF